jgi:hypothetical protein
VIAGQPYGQAAAQVPVSASSISADRFPLGGTMH